MIQRKQSIFLFLSAVFLSLDLFFPLASFIGDKDSIVLYVYKIVSLVPDSTMPYNSNFILPLLILVLLSIIIILGTIFIYKNRKAQMKMVKLALLFVVIFIGIFFLYYVNALEQYTDGVAQYNYIGSSAPLLALVFLVLAYRGILQDEKLVRSADRLR